MIYIPGQAAERWVEQRIINAERAITVIIRLTRLDIISKIQRKIIRIPDRQRVFRLFLRPFREENNANEENHCDKENQIHVPIHECHSRS